MFMDERKFDVFGIGNAIVDILCFVPDQFIIEHKLQRGSMTLMDSKQQAKILHDLEHHKLELASGGSAANTMVAIAQSGGTGVYCGKVTSDTNGEFYQQDLESSGIKFEVELAPEASEPTGTCVVLTTPDAERTMCTHLGVSTSLSTSDLDVDRLSQCQFSYIEGYLWDAPGPKQTCIQAMQASKKHKVKVAMTFSDPFLVDRYHRELKDVVSEYCDVLFLNADEARRFCESDSLEECAAQMGSLAPVVFMTDSENGCRVISGSDIQQVDGFPVKPLDTVGAGDAFAGGALFGLTHQMTLQQAARWGNYFASRIVQINGSRLDEPMTSHLKQIISS